MTRELEKQDIRFVERVKVSKKSWVLNPENARKWFYTMVKMCQFLSLLRIKPSNVAPEGYFKTTSMGLSHFGAIKGI